MKCKRIDLIILGSNKNYAKKQVLAAKGNYFLFMVSRNILMFSVVIKAIKVRYKSV